MDSSLDPLSNSELLQAIRSGDPSRAMPALASLRQLPAPEAIPLLLIGLQQTAFAIRSLCCAGLGYKRSEQGRQALVKVLKEDPDANVRAEAANALAYYGVVEAWPLLRQTFVEDDHWLVRCSILAALAEDPTMQSAWLLDLAELALADTDGTVRVGGAELLGRLLGLAPVPASAAAVAEQARERLRSLTKDPDHLVVAAALNGLHGQPGSTVQGQG
ncbi:MAG: HEAT repeat domain-containing protein [Cyanobium sp. 49614_E6]|nr:HEAT repeat domain-containing protein [Cyanobium sp. 49614_E6]